jgi:hypothetical protein
MNGPTLCIQECVFGTGGDQTCQARNSDNICEQFGAAPDTFAVCFPKCTANDQCPSMNCNVTTGHCL